MLFLSPLPASPLSHRAAQKTQGGREAVQREPGLHIAWIQKKDLGQSYLFILTLGRAWPYPHPSVAVDTFSTTLSWWVLVSSTSVHTTRTFVGLGAQILCMWHMCTHMHTELPFVMLWELRAEAYRFDMLNFSDFPRFLQMLKEASRSAELDLSLDHDRLLRGQNKGRLLCKVSWFFYKRTSIPSFKYVRLYAGEACVI